MPKYASFENRSVSWTWVPVDGKQAQFQPLGVERVYQYVQFRELPSLFYAKTGMQILNLLANSVF